VLRSLVLGWFARCPRQRSKESKAGESKLR